MSGLRRGHGIPGEVHGNLEDVRRLELRYSRAQPEKMNLYVEYVSGRIKVYEVDRETRPQIAQLMAGARVGRKLGC